jgi:CheY-like chemotaxis protein
MMTPLNRKFLLADDDSDDAALFCEAVTRIGPVLQCVTVENGVELFELLSRHEDTGEPDVIFLDINMPLMDGWDCLKKLKNSNYRNIPTIMYSTSSAKRDIDMAYSLGAILFVTKPENFKELCNILQVVASSTRDSLVSRLSGFDSVKLN